MQVPLKIDRLLDLSLITALDRRGGLPPFIQPLATLDLPLRSAF